MHQHQKRFDTEVKLLEAKLPITEKAQTKAEIARDKVVTSKTNMEGEISKAEYEKKFIEEELTSLRDKNFDIQAKVG